MFCKINSISVQTSALLGFFCRLGAQSGAWSSCVRLPWPQRAREGQGGAASGRDAPAAGADPAAFAQFLSRALNFPLFHVNFQFTDGRWEIFAQQDRREPLVLPPRSVHSPGHPGTPLAPLPSTVRLLWLRSVPGNRVGSGQPGPRMLRAGSGFGCARVSLCPGASALV